MLEVGRQGILLGATLCACAGSAGGGGARTSAEDACRSFQVDIRRAWTDDVRASLAFGADGAGSPVGGSVGGARGRGGTERILTRMDAASRDWVMMREQLCRDREHRRIGARSYERRSACLDAWLRRFRAATQIASRSGAPWSDSIAAFDEVLHISCDGEAPVARATAASPGP